MVEPGSGEDKPKVENDTITDDLRTAVEFFNSPDIRERKFGAIALARAASIGVDSPEAGQKLSRLLRVRDDEDDSEPGLSLHSTDEAIRRTLERHERLIGGIHNVVVDLDPNGYISYVNQAITEITGFEGEGLLDMKFTQIVHPEGHTKSFKDAQRYV